MKIKKETLVKEEKIEKVICNKCGEEIAKDRTGEFYDYLSIYKEWGYLSDLDGEKHSFELCEKCYRKVIKDFKIPPEIQ